MLTRVPGAGESGKSTILKQMRLIHNDGFPLHERKEIRQVIFSNMVVAFRVIAEEMRDLGLTYELEGTEVDRIHRVRSEYGLRNGRNTNKFSCRRRTLASTILSPWTVCLP
jgi:hypothetical protein